MQPIIVKMRKHHTLYALRFDQFITNTELQRAQEHYGSVEKAIEMIVDFCDYLFIFGDNLNAKEVGLSSAPTVYNAVYNAATRLHTLLQFDPVQVAGYKTTTTALFMIITREVPDNERLGVV